MFWTAKYCLTLIDGAAWCRASFSVTIARITPIFSLFNGASSMDRLCFRRRSYDAGSERRQHFYVFNFCLRSSRPLAFDKLATDGAISWWRNTICIVEHGCSSKVWITLRCRVESERPWGTVDGCRQQFCCFSSGSQNGIPKAYNLRLRHTLVTSINLGSFWSIYFIFLTCFGSERTVWSSSVATLQFFGMLSSGSPNGIRKAPNLLMRYTIISIIELRAFCSFQFIFPTCFGSERTVQSSGASTTNCFWCRSFDAVYRRYFIILCGAFSPCVP